MRLAQGLMPFITASTARDDAISVTRAEPIAELVRVRVWRNSTHPISPLSGLRRWRKNIFRERPQATSAAISAARIMRGRAKMPGRKPAAIPPAWGRGRSMSLNRTCGPRWG